MSQTQTAPETVAPAPPDVNIQTHPFDYVTALLEETTYLNALAVAAPQPEATLTPGDPSDYFGIQGGYGIALGSELRHVESAVIGPQLDTGLSLNQSVGRAFGRLVGRWFFAPEDHPWTPGVEPPPTLFDPWRRQHFVMLDTGFDFNNSRHGFRGYGMGCTFPLTVRGENRVMAGGVANLTRGFGKFAGVEATLVFNGEIRHLGFEGHISVRLIDPNGIFKSEREIAPVTDQGLEPSGSLLVMRGQKKDSSVRTEYGPPAGDLVRLVTPAQMRSAEYRFAVGGDDGPRGQMIERQVIGSLRATVTLDILAPPGTAERPNDFSTVNVYRFTDPEGREVGTVTARVELGKSFNLTFPAIPDQPAMRYGGFGPIVEGTGFFRGVAGSLCVNSAIGIQPHALAMLNVLRFVDPDHRFRTGG